MSDGINSQGVPASALKLHEREPQANREPGSSVSGSGPVTAQDVLKDIERHWLRSSVEIALLLLPRDEIYDVVNEVLYGSRS